MKPSLGLMVRRFYVRPQSFHLLYPIAMGIFLPTFYAYSRAMMLASETIRTAKSFFAMLDIFI
jgi:hypothetical protein